LVGQPLRAGFEPREPFSRFGRVVIFRATVDRRRCGVEQVAL
jgi:hypothetical protein